MSQKPPILNYEVATPRGLKRAALCSLLASILSGPLAVGMTIGATIATRGVSALAIIVAMASLLIWFAITIYAFAVCVGVFKIAGTKLERCMAVAAVLIAISWPMVIMFVH